MEHHYRHTAVTQVRQSVGNPGRRENRRNLGWLVHADTGLVFNAVSQNRALPPLSLVA